MKEKNFEVALAAQEDLKKLIEDIGIDFSLAQEISKIGSENYLVTVSWC